MATYSVLACLALFSVTANLCHSSLINRKVLNYGSSSGSSLSTATWYGDPYGYGSSGGSCGYETAVESAPFSSMITAVSPFLYDNGHACGSCFQVKCTSPPELCSGIAVTVVVTDSCPGCDNTYSPHYFDLSGSAFGKMALPGHDKQLRDLGHVEVEYESVACNFPGTNVAFKVDTGSNANYFAMEVEFEDGFELVKVEIQSSASGAQWMEMQLSWGARYKVDNPGAAPFSIRLTEKGSSSPIVAVNVIPANYKPGETYRSLVNFAV